MHNPLFPITRLAAEIFQACRSLPVLSAEQWFQQKVALKDQLAELDRQVDRILQLGLPPTHPLLVSDRQAWEVDLRRALVDLRKKARQYVRYALRAPGLRLLGSVSPSDVDRAVGRLASFHHSQEELLNRVHGLGQKAASGALPVEALPDHNDEKQPVLTRDEILIRAEILTRADLSVLQVLADWGRALTQSEIVRKVAALCREGGHKFGFVPVGQTTLSGRLKLLRAAGYVAAPTDAAGKPSTRKGIGITEEGRVALESAKRRG